MTSTGGRSLSRPCSDGAMGLRPVTLLLRSRSPSVVFSGSLDSMQNAFAGENDSPMSCRSKEAWKADGHC